ncbi:MAG: sulfatase-like hydrolase/transferase [Verrucomicrobiota bacterium JB024]|nr:sulfatase-like hydrolase/transferase [Verrucomicrobiota bacterium JB024]
MSSEKRPNILFVIADDHRADAIGALGHPVVQTPVLDSLVAEGTTFTRARIMGSLLPAVCAPSRACILTGLGMFQADSLAHCHPRPNREVSLCDQAVTLPQAFRSQGYETFLTGKWHNDVASALRSFDSGGDIFHGGMCEHTSVPLQSLKDMAEGHPASVGEGFSSEIFCDMAAEFIRSREKDRPFFVWLALTSPHDPRTPPEPYNRAYAPSEIPLPGNFLPEHPFDNGELDIRDEKLAPRPRTPERMQRELADYYGMISHQDACLGRVLKSLVQAGEDDNTIVVYVSDHGLAMGSHGLLGKQNLYEHSVRVPLIMRGPGVPRGKSCSQELYSLDLFATLGELAGVETPHGLESLSFVPAMNGCPQVTRDVFFCAYAQCQRSAFDGRWKLIQYRVKDEERVQLFDLEADPDECRDLASETASTAVIGRLSRRLNAWREANGDRFSGELGV